ncbi:MAG: 4-hydroxy-tetrahydrodipicolinate reductase [Rhodospirillales bacterium]
MNIAVAGCAGRMGRMLIRAAAEAEGARLSGGLCAPGSPALGADLAGLAGLAGSAAGVSASDDAEAVFKAADAVCDFTTPEVTAALAALAAKTGTALVTGTTGLSAAHQAAVEQAAQKIPVVQAANYSLGVNVLLGLAERAAAALGPDYDIEVSEAHHRRKVDAPSGTALALGAALAKGRGIDLAAMSERARDGVTGPRKPGAIGFAVTRAGDIVGEHTVMLAGPKERVILGHAAADRQTFADGAVQAALWTQARAPGLYSMRDVLGLD